MFTEEAAEQLNRVKERLSDPARTRDSAEWLDIYSTKFQAVLDGAASERVGRCATWVGWKTAVSPNALVDTLITLYWSFRLLRDLCVIYNVRVGGYGTVLLLSRVFFLAYLAGKIDDWEDSADSAVETLFDAAPPLIQKLVGKFTSKAGAGLANYFMLKRLGKRAIVMLRPLALE